MTADLYDLELIRKTLPTPELADVLRRLADNAIRPIASDDPLQHACENYERLWALAGAVYEDAADDDSLADEVRELSDELERHILGTVATSKIGLICQLRMAQHEIFKRFEDNPDMDSLIEVVVRGINVLLPEKRVAPLASAEM